EKWVKVSPCAGLTGFGIAASYNPVRKVVVFGGGSQAAPPWANYRNWYQLDAEGKVSPLDDSPVDSYAATSTLFTVDPISGKHLLIRPNDFDYKKTTGFWFYELDLTQKAGSQWSERKDLEAAIPQFNSRSPNHVFATVVVPLPEYGVNMFMGPEMVWIYKHDAKPPAAKWRKAAVQTFEVSGPTQTLQSRTGLPCLAPPVLPTPLPAPGKCCSALATPLLYVEWWSGGIIAFSDRTTTQLSPTLAHRTGRC